MRILRPMSLVVCLICFLQGSRSTIAQEPHDRTPTIEVQGEAKETVAPDQVILRIGIESRGKTVDDAIKDNDGRRDLLLNYLKKQSIESKFVQTEQISIEPIEALNQQSKSNQMAQRIQSDDPFGASGASPDSSLERRLPVGYFAKRMMSVKISDLKTFEPFYKGLLQQGVNRVQGVEFQYSAEKELLSKLRLLAVADAKEKSQAMAQVLDAKLHAVRSIKEIRSGSSEYDMRDYSSDPFGSSRENNEISAGEISFYASVRVEFVLGEAEL